MISLVIDAKEQHDVATANVDRAYFHADMEDFVLLKLVGEAANIMCHVNPQYEKFVVIENGKKVLNLQVLKALYGCVQSALFMVQLVHKHFGPNGFQVESVRSMRCEQQD